MLRVQLEVVPLGVLDPEPIGWLEIVNDGTGDAVYASYRYRVGTIRDGRERVSRYRALPGRHDRTTGAFPLVAACLDDHARRERAAGRTWIGP